MDAVERIKLEQYLLSDQIKYAIDQVDMISKLFGYGTDDTSLTIKYFIEQRLKVYMQLSEIMNEAIKEQLQKLLDLLDKAIPIKCPPLGEAFYGYKVVMVTKETCNFYVDCSGDPVTADYTPIYEEVPAICKLYIPENSKRSSAFGNKCRCEYAIVDSIYLLDEKHVNKKLYIGPNVAAKPPLWNNLGTEYRVGCECISDHFNENRWIECSSGIHFFMTEEEAMELYEHFSKYSN